MIRKYKKVIIMVKKVVDLLLEKKLTIGSVESLTGGLFASSITTIPGVSKIYKGSIVSYATEVKENVVNVDKEVISSCGVVSKECALEMAKQGKKLLNTDICISFTGNAGPSVMENKEVGKVYIGLAIKEDIEVYEFNFFGNRDLIREKCVKTAFEKIFEKISSNFLKIGVMN